MRKDKSITYLSGAALITCIVESGRADKVVSAARNVGAEGATVTYARGSGIRERMGLAGLLINGQKEVIRVIVSEEQAALVFDAIYKAAEMDTPGRGIITMTPLARVATYIPPDILDVREAKRA